MSTLRLRNDHDPIAATMTELRRRLPLPLRSAGLLTEIEDGLCDAAEAYRRAGLPAQEAARQAVIDFGPLESAIADCGNTAVARLCRLTARVLIIGYALTMTGWFTLGVVEPNAATGLAHGPSMITYWFATLALTVMIGGHLMLRRLRSAARRQRPTVATATAAAATAIACCALTMISSYVVSPWDFSAWQPDVSLHDVVEVGSGVIQLIILAAGLSCLAAALRMRRITGRRTASPN